MGKTYEPSTWQIKSEDTKKYAEAVGDLNPLYLDEAKAKNSKHGGLIAPPMFAVVYSRDVVGQAILDSELGIDFMRMVHGEQGLEFKKIVKIGDAITTEGKLTEIFEKKGLEFVILETRSRNQDGEEVCVGEWTFIQRGG